MYGGSSRDWLRRAKHVSRAIRDPIIKGDLD
jgi:hypothetical protein